MKMISIQLDLFSIDFFYSLEVSFVTIVSSCTIAVDECWLHNADEDLGESIEIKLDDPNYLITRGLRPPLCNSIVNLICLSLFIESLIRMGQPLSIVPMVRSQWQGVLWMISFQSTSIMGGK